MSEPILERLLRGQGWMESWGDAVQGLVGRIYGTLGPLGRPLKNLAHGTQPLHHPLHPALTDAPLGAWLVGLALDYAAAANHSLPHWPGDAALAAGTLAALAAVLTGYTDFHETFGLERRTALTHGLLMTTVFLLECVSLAIRLWGGSGAHGLAVVIATIAVLLAALGMYVGGHLVYGFGTMVNRNAFAEGNAEEFVAVGKPADFPEGSLKRVDAAGLPALVVRTGGKLLAIGAVCSHAGGPLEEGELKDGTVICPWHGSCFRLSDGTAVTGPATFAEPVFAVREREGQVELKLERPLH